MCAKFHIQSLLASSPWTIFPTMYVLCQYWKKNTSKEISLEKKKQNNTYCWSIQSTNPSESKFMASSSLCMVNSKFSKLGHAFRSFKHEKPRKQVVPLKASMLPILAMAFLSFISGILSIFSGTRLKHMLFPLLIKGIYWQAICNFIQSI